MAFSLDSVNDFKSSHIVKNKMFITFLLDRVTHKECHFNGDLKPKDKTTLSVNFVFCLAYHFE